MRAWSLVMLKQMFVFPYTYSYSWHFFSFFVAWYDGFETGRYICFPRALSSSQLCPSIPEERQDPYIWKSSRGYWKVSRLKSLAINYFTAPRSGFFFLSELLLKPLTVPNSPRTQCSTKTAEPVKPLTVKTCRWTQPTQSYK